MKKKYVKTKNQERLTAGVWTMENKGSDSACLMFLNGDPGVGKTREVDHWGAKNGAVFIRGHVGMTLTGLRWSLSHQLGLPKFRNSSEEMQAQIAALAEGRHTIIFDEAQFGLSMRQQGAAAAGIEYLRLIGEAARIFVILVCHSSETAGFTRHAHISTRISYNCKLYHADLEDTTKFINELCDVSVDDAVAKVVFEQSGGRFRLVENAISNLDLLAAGKGLAALAYPDILATNGKPIRLVVDHEKSMIPGCADERKPRATKIVANKPATEKREVKA